MANASYSFSLLIILTCLDELTIKENVDYGLTVEGNVQESEMKNAADHDVVVKGNIEHSLIDNYGSNGKQPKISSF